MSESNLKLLNTKLLEKIRGLNEQIAELKLNNDSQNKIDQLLAQLAACTDENKKLKEEIQFIQSTRDSVISNSQNEIQQLKQSLCTLQNVNLTTESRNSELSRENSILLDKSTALTRELVDIKDELNKERSVLQSKTEGKDAALAKELDDMKNELTVSQGKSAALTKELDDMKYELTVSQGKSAALTKELDDIKDELARANKERSALLSKNAALMKEVGIIKDKLTRENTWLQGENAVLTKELAHMKKHMIENVAVVENSQVDKFKTKSGKNIKKTKQAKSVYTMDDMDIYDSEDIINMSQFTSSSVASAVGMTNKVNDYFIPDSLGAPTPIEDMEQKLSEIQRDDQLSWSGCMKNLSIYPSSPYHRNNVTIKKDLSNDTDFSRVATDETQPHLIVLLRNGEKSDNLCVIGNNGITVGREADCDIRIKLPSVSRLHAKLVINNKGLVVLQNFSKTNPTLLNDVAIESAVLKNGDTLCIAGRYFRFQGNESISNNGSARNDHIKFSSSSIQKPTSARTVNALSFYNKLVNKTDKKNIFSETESSIIRKISRFS